MDPARAYGELDSLEDLARRDSLIHRLDPRIKIVTVACFLICLLSVSPYDLPLLLGMAVIPVVWSLWAQIDSGFLLKRALLTLPFVVFIGIFNPVFDTKPLVQLGSWTISGGWVSFASIILRAVLAAWVALLLLATTGFFGICRGLGEMKVPSLLTTQFLFVFRYIFVLVEETLRMLRARSLRNPQGKREPLSHWASFVGTLLLRSLDRASRLHRALLARGFTGEFRVPGSSRLGKCDVLFLAGALLLIAWLRFGHPAGMLGRLLGGSGV